MSAHFSKFLLNTYSWSPYFETHVPKDYPTSLVLQKARAFRRLPHNLRQLAAKAKQWAERMFSEFSLSPIKDWYNDDGDELNPTTGGVLTDAEIDREWEQLGLELDSTDIEDIPIPKGGFADPDTWKEPPPPPEEPDPDSPTAESLLDDIGSHGREYVAKDYGVTDEGGNDVALARAILAKLGQ